MTNAELIKKIRRQSGPIYADVPYVHDIIRVQIVKKDLLEILNQYDPKESANFDLMIDNNGWTVLTANV